MRYYLFDTGATAVHHFTKIAKEHRCYQQITFMIKIGTTLLKIVNIIVVFFYLLACLIPFLPAGEYWWIAVLGLIFPIIAFIVFGFLIVWLIGRSRWFLLSLAALLLSASQLSVMAGFNAKKPFIAEKQPGTLRVLTWNTSAWGQGSKKKSEEKNVQQSMLKLVLEHQPDVLCFQEFWDRQNPRDTNSVIKTIKRNGYPYAYFVKTVIDELEVNLGVAIFSKYPFTDTAQFAFGKEDFAEHLISADIRFNDKDIKIFTTHLQSVQFEDSEYSTINKLKQTEKSGLGNYKTIVRKLKNAYHFRGGQSDLVQQKLGESEHPVIICGDFNDVPNSYTYFTIGKGLQDAFLKKGSGLGRTFLYLSPTLRIDYILADKQMKVTQFNLVKTPYSDHYPILADFSIQP